MRAYLSLELLDGTHHHIREPRILQQDIDTLHLRGVRHDDANLGQLCSAHVSHSCQPRQMKHMNVLTNVALR